MGKKKYNTEEERKEATKKISREARKRYYYKHKELELKRNRNYKQKNKKSIAKKEKEKRKLNPEKYKKYYKDYYEKNSKKIIQQKIEYQKNNFKKTKEDQKNYRLNNKDKLKELQKLYKKERRLNDSLFKLKHNISCLIRISFKNKKQSKSKKSLDILGCSINQFKTHIEKQFEPWMNWGNYGKYNGSFNYGWDLDHIIPLANAKTEEDVIKLNHYTNLRPLCSYSNRVVKNRY